MQYGLALLSFFSPLLSCSSHYGVAARYMFDDRNIGISARSSSISSFQTMRRPSFEPVSSIDNRVRSRKSSRIPRRRYFPRDWDHKAMFLSFARRIMNTDRSARFKKLQCVNALNFRFLPSSLCTKNFRFDIISRSLHWRIIYGLWKLVVMQRLNVKLEGPVKRYGSISNNKSWLRIPEYWTSSLNSRLF